MLAELHWMHCNVDDCCACCPAMSAAAVCHPGQSPCLHEQRAGQLPLYKPAAVSSGCYLGLNGTAEKVSFHRL
jgi:hypothetical protein